jgi:hypothetical protein
VAVESNDLRKHSPIRREQWLRENADAIAEYNALVARLGTFTSRSTQRSGPSAASMGFVEEYSWRQMRATLRT